MNPRMPAIPVVDLNDVAAGDSAQLDAVRAGTEELRVIQVVNHGVSTDLIGDFDRRMARLLGLPRAENGGLPDRIRPSGADSGLARRPALRLQAGRERNASGSLR